MSVFRSTPVGWGRASRRRIAAVREAADNFIQKLNDRFANPSGGGSTPETAAPVHDVDDAGHSQAESVRQASGQGG